MQKQVEEHDLLVVDLLKQLSLFENEELITYVKALLNREECNHLWQVLMRNKDAFAWKHSNMPNINLVVASHKLNIIPTTQLLR